MLQPDSPVYVRPIASPAFIRFMVGMARACTPRAYAAAFDAVARLGRGTFDELDQWLADGIEFEIHDAGELRVFVEPRELARAAAELPRAERAGFEPELLDGATARALVPELSDAVVGAIRFRGARHVRPASLVGGARTPGARPGSGDGRRSGRARRRSILRRRGARRRVRRDLGRRCRSLRPVPGAATWRACSAPRSRSDPARATASTYGPGALPSAIPLMLAEAHCVMTPFDARDPRRRHDGVRRLRRARVDARRVRALRRAPARYLRAWDPEAPSEPAVAGLHPMTPDGLPVLSRLRGPGPVWVASGHAMLGLTLAPRTGALFATMLLDGTEPDEVRPFSPRRFGA